MYTGIKFEPIISREDHPSTKKERLIKDLKYWVVVLAMADILYTALAILMIWNEVIK